MYVDKNNAVRDRLKIFIMAWILLFLLENVHVVQQHYSLYCKGLNYSPSQPFKNPIDPD